MKILLILLPVALALKQQINPIHTVQKTKKLDIYDACNVKAPTCDPNAKYRSFDGSCNNLEHPTWGMNGSPYIRLFDNNYSDNKELPPVATDGSELPNARKLVTSLFPDENKPDTVSLILAQFGQFIAHDTATNVVKEGVSDCCSSDDILTCFNIPIPEDDPFYSQFNQTCLSLTRSRTVPCDGQLIQINGVTHGIDGSQIYGSDSVKADSIREHKGGRLSVRIISDGRCFMTSNSNEECYNSDVCYAAGEARVNQNIQLTILHTLFTREHNRIADALSLLNPSWDDETLYQETRRIVIAEYSHIVFNEFLPYVITEEVMRKNNLKAKEKDYTQYDPEIPNVVVLSYINPVYRIFHSGLQGLLGMYNYHYHQMNSIDVSDYMNSPGLLEEENHFDELLLGLITQPMQQIDPFYPAQLAGRMFHFGKPFGQDLNALDIQRARDHGIPVYATVLYSCTGREVQSFDDLSDLWPSDKIELVKSLYKTVEDVDLFIGINFENKIEGHRFSPVSECLITEQFYRWKNGDRYYYEVGDQPHSFTTDQLDEIRKSKLSRIICDNSDHIVNITQNIWMPPSDTNLIVPCETIPSVDLSKFVEN